MSAAAMPEIPALGQSAWRKENIMRMKPLKLPNTIQLKMKPGGFYNFAAGLYLLHMAVMANLTLCFKDALLRFRMPSFLLVAVLALVAVGYRAVFRGVPRRTLLFYLIFFSMAISGVLYQMENFTYIKRFLFTGSFIKFILLFSLVFVFEEEPETRVRQLTVISIVSLLVYQLGVSCGAFIDEGGELAYMNVGYGSVPWWTIVAQGIFYYKKRFVRLICFLTAVYFAIFITVYGNRGALVVVLVAMAVFLVVYVPLKHLVLLGGFFLSAILGALLFLEPILEMAGGLLGFDLAQSRNFRLLTRGLIDDDAGRFRIWKVCFDAILEHPLLGNGSGGDRVANFVSRGRAAYAHNIVIELCVDFGVVIGLLIFGWLLYIGFRMVFKCRDRDWKALFLPFYVFSMVELFFSDTLYQSGYLLAAAVIYVVYFSRSRCLSRRRYEEPVPALRPIKGESS